MKNPPVIVGIGKVLWDIYPDAARFVGAPANFATHATPLVEPNGKAELAFNAPLTPGIYP
jgi:hypothetical protein